MHPIPDGETLAKHLNADGYAVAPLLPAEACQELADLYDQTELFRKRIVMEHRAYGKGEYQYFAYPLPTAIATLRAALYPPLAEIANIWRRTLGDPGTFPATLDEYLGQCHAAGQARPTPLLLRYGAGGFNCLHQDLYGELAFPLQATILLSAPGRDFTGGEFILVEQRPRAQSRPAVVTLRQGDAVIFPCIIVPALVPEAPTA